uniref:Phosphoribosylaminoimidazole-succinocarboxamide synthase n=1 Tax=uncultured marine thaumarchaeote KM3_71_C08 TaxID=1456257 RepID=A0A075HGS9_9ARCH|nr:phosphoribosylaminoimidazolesuccinocarboxamide synthase (purC) [uncultured marine thaumarchaeote KM3_71_C08]
MQLKFLTSGKVKDVYELEDGKLLFKFSNRVSAYDVKFKDEIPRKGEILCKFAEYWFKKLDVPNHFVERKSNTEIIVKKMDMLPIECVVRGYFYGGLFSRWKNGKISLEKDAPTELAAQLPNPIFDPTTKSTHDIPVNRDEAISQKLVTTDEYDWLSEKSIKIYKKIAEIADNAGFILADLKLEFGKLNNEIILADSIGPDEFRLWPKDAYKIDETQEAYDKQLLRDWLTENGYQKKFDDARLSGEEPIAPSIPSDLVSKMTQRYVTAYERLTGNTL